jgi:hypothetical protein
MRVYIKPWEFKQNCFVQGIEANSCFKTIQGFHIATQKLDINCRKELLWYVPNLSGTLTFLNNILILYKFLNFPLVLSPGAGNSFRDQNNNRQTFLNVSKEHVCIMALHPFSLALAVFPVSWSYAQSIGLLLRGISSSQVVHTRLHKHRISTHRLP